MSLTTLGDLLGQLHRQSACGALELLDTRGVCHRLGLVEGLVDGIESPLRVTPVGERLRRSGRLSEASFGRFVANMRMSPGVRSGQVLLEHKLVRPSDLRQALREQLRERLEKLYALGEAEVRFRPPRGLRGAESGLCLAPGEFLHGRPRARQKVPPPTQNHEGTERQAALALLGVGSDANPDQIRHAFRSLARRAHPDHSRASSEDEARGSALGFAQLSAAYHSLIR